MNRTNGDFPGVLVLRWASLLLVFWGVLTMSITGCSKPAESPSKRAATESLDGDGRENSAEECFNFAMSNLNRFDEFDPGAMLRQIVDRLNRWAKAQAAIPAWRRDPLLDTLPASLSQIPELQNLETLEFDNTDGALLREAAWLRDVSRWARGAQADDLARACRLFDWTMRNVQVVTADAIKQLPTGKWLPQLAWQALLTGEGAAWERAWVFILLCRAQGIDAAVLAVAPTTAESAPVPWAVGVRIDRKIYLFEPVLGVPLPARDGIRLDDKGRLDIVPATLEQAAADDSLLRRLDVGGAEPYPLKAEQLKRTVVLIEAAPWFLSRRMKLVEAHMAGEAKLVLTVDASAQAARWKECPLVATVRLWDLPYTTVESQRHATKADLQQFRLLALPFDRVAGRELWKGRLRHLRGDFLGDEGAVHSYQAARPADEDLGRIEGRIAQKHFEHARKTRPGQSEATLKNDALNNTRVDALAIIRGKMNATYWLGVISYERGDFAEAVEYFGKRTLGLSQPSPWNVGAHYNLGRSYEALKEDERALTQYRSVKPADPGILLRALWLEKSKVPSDKKPSGGKNKS